MIGMSMESVAAGLNEMESNMYQIKDGDYEDEVTAGEKEAIVKVIKLAKYISENYSEEDFQ